MLSTFEPHFKCGIGRPESACERIRIIAWFCEDLRDDRTYKSEPKIYKSGPKIYKYSNKY